MKTSNKLLLGFFCLVVANLVIANVAVKSEISKKDFKQNIEQGTDSIKTTKSNNQIHLKF
jgi:hypothetical protein